MPAAALLPLLPLAALGRAATQDAQHTPDLQIMAAAQHSKGSCRPSRHGAVGSAAAANRLQSWAQTLLLLLLLVALSTACRSRIEGHILTCRSV
jgi:hypothetical protein